MKAVFIALLFTCVNAQAAMGPFDVYEQALRNDPVFLGAIKERDAGLENRTIGRAGLLPKLSYNYNKGRNNSQATLPDGRGGTYHDDRNYNSYGSTFSLQQPLFDYEAYANYRKGVAQALFADESFRDKSQALLVRVLSYYTQALFAQDQIDIARAKKKAFEQQFQQNRHLFQQGEGTRTDVLETQARLSLALAQEIEAQDQQDAALRELQAIVGEPLQIDELDPLVGDLKDFDRNQASTYGTTPPFNFTGQPSLSLPLWQGEGDLPIGMMFTGQFGDEAAFAVEGLQVVLAQCLIVAAQQHVLPFLHLPAELTLQALGVAAVGDLRGDFGGQLQPGRRQARQGAYQDNGQTNRNGTEQLRLQPRRMGRGFHGTRSRKGCDAVSTIL